jgi:hypothetical protein
VHRDAPGKEIDGDTAYIVWKAETADNRFELGTDTFIPSDFAMAIVARPTPELAPFWMTHGAISRCP